ncbi:MAG TPA: DUF3305 domain-containing protein [Chromatiales bacterium]|nr:DUF3305 domain-containing protein [Chromatiales bacterium]
MGGVRTTTEAYIPVGVLLAREEVRMGRWRVPRWSARGVVAGAAAGATRRLLRCDERSQEWLVGGLALRLYRDEAEGYWFNLSGERPRLFVVCRPESGGGMTPFLVTADGEEAAAYEEGGDQVFAVPMPPEVYRLVEDYVLTHFRPTPKRKRKRVD